MLNEEGINKYFSAGKTTLYLSLALLFFLCINQFTSCSHSMYFKNRTSQNYVPIKDVYKAIEKRDFIKDVEREFFFEKTRDAIFRVYSSNISNVVIVEMPRLKAVFDDSGEMEDAALVFDSWPDALNYFPAASYNVNRSNHLLNGHLLTQADFDLASFDYPRRLSNWLGLNDSLFDKKIHYVPFSIQTALDSVLLSTEIRKDDLIALSLYVSDLISAKYGAEFKSRKSHYYNLIEFYNDFNDGFIVEVYPIILDLTMIEPQERSLDLNLLISIIPDIKCLNKYDF